MKLPNFKSGFPRSTSKYKFNKNKNHPTSLKQNSKSNQFLKPILLIISTLICLLSFSPQPRKNKFVQVIVQNTSEDLSLLTEDFLHELSRLTKKDDRFILEQARGDGVVALYSGSAKRNLVRTSTRELDVSEPSTLQLEPVTSTETAFTAMVQRCADYVYKVAASPKRDNIELHCFVISPGTNNQKVLDEVLDISQNISQISNSFEFYLHIVGLDSHYRLNLTNYFSPLSDSINVEQVDFSSRLDEEWLKQINSLK